MADTIAAGTVQARVSGLQIPQNTATQTDSAKQLIRIHPYGGS